MKQTNHLEITVISATITPDIITNAMGLAPTRAWLAGDLRPKTIIREKSNGWSLKIEVPPEAPMELHVEAMLKKLRSAKISMQGIAAAVDVYVNFTIYGSARTGFLVDKEFSGMISALNANIDFEFYLI